MLDLMFPRPSTATRISSPSRDKIAEVSSSRSTTHPCTVHIETVENSRCSRSSLGMSSTFFLRRTTRAMPSPIAAAITRPTTTHAKVLVSPPLSAVAAVVVGTACGVVVTAGGVGVTNC